MESEKEAPESPVREVPAPPAPMLASSRGSENNLLPPAAVSYFPLIQYHSSAHKSGKGEILITEETSVIAPIKEALPPLEVLVPMEDPVPYDVSLEDDILSPEPPEIDEPEIIEIPPAVVDSPFVSRLELSETKNVKIQSLPVVEPLVVPSVYGDSSNDYFDNISHLAPSVSHGSVPTPFAVSRGSGFGR